MADKTIKVIAGLINHNGRFLIAKRNLKKSLGGLWEFPGGKIDDYETPKECLKRELMEELNIETEIGDFICNNTHDYGDFKIDLHLYKVKSFSGNIIKSEHEDIKWISKVEFDNYKFAPADIPIIEKLNNL